MKRYMCCGVWTQNNNLGGLIHNRLTISSQELHSGLADPLRGLTATCDPRLHVLPSHNWFPVTMKPEQERKHWLWGCPGSETWILLISSLVTLVIGPHHGARGLASEGDAWWYTVKLYSDREDAFWYGVHSILWKGKAQDRIEPAMWCGHRAEDWRPYRSLLIEWRVKKREIHTRDSKCVL